MIVGSLVMLSSIGAVALAAYPAWRVMSHPGDDQARQIILNDCTTCHGLGVVAGEGEEAGKWYEVLDEMAEKAAKRGMADPSQGQRDRLVAFLASLNPGGHGGGEGDENSGGSRRRRREDED
jgi:hypothetical protein